MVDWGVPGGQFGGWLAEAGDALVSVLFPAGCRLCEQLLTRSSRIPICDQCLASFAALPMGGCPVCGAPPENAHAGAYPGIDAQPGSGTNVQPPLPASDPVPQAVVCGACRVGTYAFDRARSWAAYDTALVHAIVMLKFERIEPLGTWFAERVAEVVRREAETLAADVVVPVPLHSERERERGYNQADLIARPLAKRLGLPYRPILLVRTRPRPDKQILSLRERWESVRGAFATRPGSLVDNLRVLLVDDVMTTGATLDACAKALRGAGAKSVIGLTVARASRHPLEGSDES